MKDDFLEYIDINLDDETEYSSTFNPNKKHSSGSVAAGTASDTDYSDADTESAATGLKNQPSKGIFIIKELLSYAIIIAVAFVLAFLTQRYLIINANIPTGSMIPTIVEGNRIIGNRLSYKFSEPERGDVVIFLYPDNEEENYVKRIIGLPGDKVEIIAGIVYINDVVLDESSYRATNPDGSYVNPAYGDYGPFYVPDNSYFMLGDNRNSSWDSRFWDNNYVHIDKILAKAIFSYYPSIHFIK